MFKIVKVDESNKEDVVKQLRLDLLRNYPIVYGLIYEPNKATAYVALGRDNSLEGLLSIYRRTPPMVRLDGEERAARKLLEHLPKENMILFCPPTLLDIVKNEIPEANCYPEHQMYVAKGEEQLVAPNLAQRLESRDASLLAELYSSGGQRFLFLRSESRCKELLEKRRVYGVFQGNRLVSVAAAVKRFSKVGEITGVLTHRDYRRRGFGILATSAATEDVLLQAGGANLYVGADNEPATKMYEKLGYKKIEEWYWVDVGTGTKP
jgi:ribosomal protein S18 acetylase RimI-like enzyme